MFYTLKLGKPVKAAMVISLLLFISAVLFSFHYDSATETMAENKLVCLVIDAGHGGIDGGAIAADGTKESKINLSIAMKMSDLADFLGIKNVMTRTDDSSRTEGTLYSEHEELVYRTEVANSLSDAVLISIHQNCYPTSQPKGAQVLYSSDNSSILLGKRTHDNIVSYLEPENRRVAEPAPESLFITSNVNCPAILVECGFISNFSDLEKLTDNTYQTSLSMVLIASYLQFSMEDAIV